MNYAPPLRTMQFALHEVLDATAILAANGIEIDRETVDDLIGGAADFCSRVLAPLNAVGDREGAQFANGTVTTPTGFKDAYNHYTVGGWPGVTCAPEDGGGGLPLLMGSVISEMLNSSASSWALFGGLSGGAYRCLRANASAALRRTYLPKLASGQWTGTMCLTEPHCGTDLGLLTTRAEPNDDGDTYRISGTKIFISSGEHDLTENVVHLVLARLPEAPAGTRGISLFAVSKFDLADGEVTDSLNGVHCDGIEHKMGMHGNPTCVMRFDNAVGHLVGEPHRGLAAMFVMMNNARLGTAVQALGLSELATQRALSYARERLQSRAPGALRRSDRAADPIIDQPDVRRMVLTQQAWTGGARLFLYWLGVQADLRQRAHDPVTREHADDLLALLTPVAKAFVSDRAVDVASLGMQIHGGAGYIADYGAEQILRDARILPIYEGTNGVQAHDLLGRKIVADGGRRLKHFLALVRTFLDEIADREALSTLHNALSALTDQVADLAADLSRLAGEDPMQVGTSAVDSLNLMGYHVIAYFWARAADVVLQLGDQATDFHRAQLAQARFYFDKMLPDTAALLIRARSSTEITMDEACISY